MTLFVGITIWFALSVATHVLGTVALRIWLAYHHVEISPLKAGMPFYLEKRYREWAESVGRSPRLLLNLRGLSAFNAILASVVFAVVVTGIHKAP
jgi:hypothetical protein